MARLPWEVRISADGIGPPLNFEKPVRLPRGFSLLLGGEGTNNRWLQVHSFDMFSLGVLALHLTIGRTEAVPT